MSSERSSDENSLRQEVERSEHVLDSLERDRQAVDAEFEVLMEKGHHFDVLSQVCQSLQELDNLGATHLFWDEHAGPENSVEHVRNARRKIDDYAEQIAELEERRLRIVDKIGEQNHFLDFLHYDLTDVIEREEARRNEWLIEREADELSDRVQVMPWARGFEEDQRFRKSLALSALASVAIALIVSSVALPILERSEMVKVPERVARLVRQELEPPPPPVPVQEPIIPQQEIPDPDPELVEEQPPVEIPESTEQPVLAEAQQPETREKVKSKGILAFRDSFASRASIRPMAQLGSQARVSDAGMNSVGRPERLMVTTQAEGSSGGINLADLSRDVGGGGQQIEGVEVARVATAIGVDGGSDRPLSGGASAGRTDEEIQIVFDRYKAALYRLYNRELRKDPTLRGQLVLRMTIEPDGSVSLCQLQSSDMQAPLLTQQVVERVSNFDFGAKEDIVAVTIIYPIDFLPAA